MGYRVRFQEHALKQLKRLDPLVARRIVNFLDDVAALDNPRERGKGLTGDPTEIWRYRIGDYRVLCEVRDNDLLILALEGGHRRGIYD